MRVGNVEVSHLCALVADMPMTLDKLFPTVPSEAWEPYRREYPGLFGAVNTWRHHAVCFLIRSRKRTILVDTGVGPSSLGMVMWLGTGGGGPPRLFTAGGGESWGGFLGGGVRRKGVKKREKTPPGGFLVTERVGVW